MVEVKVILSAEAKAKLGFAQVAIGIARQDVALGALLLGYLEPLEPSEVAQAMLHGLPQMSALLTEEADAKKPVAKKARVKVKGGGPKKPKKKVSRPSKNAAKQQKSASPSRTKRA